MYMAATMGSIGPKKREEKTITSTLLMFTIITAPASRFSRELPLKEMIPTRKYVNARTKATRTAVNITVGSCLKKDAYS